MARLTIRRRSLAVALGMVVATATAPAAFADIDVSPSIQPAGGSGVLTFRVTDDIPDAGTTRFELDLPADHPLLGVVPASKFGWDMAVEHSPVAGPTAGRVTRVIWSALSSTTAIQPRHFTTFTIGVRQFPSDTSVVRIRALQTWSNSETVEWFDPLVPGGPTPLHPAPEIRLTRDVVASGSPTVGPAPAVTAAVPTTTPTAVQAPPTVSATPIVALPTVRGGPTTDEVHTALALAAGAFALALIATAMAGVALARRPRATEPTARGADTP